jgi:proteasome lid subunit RPN8/RPN11
MKIPKIMLKPQCVDVLVASAVEVFPRETNGLLIGKKAYIMQRTRKKPVIATEFAYPLQTEERKPSSVSHANFSALTRLLSVISVMNKNLIGGFHSHPYPRGHTLLTKSDVDFISEELERTEKHAGQPMNKWIELVMSVKKKDYENLIQPGKQLYNHNRRIRVVVRTEKYTGFDIKIAGYLVHKINDSLKKKKIDLLYAG